MARKKPITVECLWQLDRLGPPSLSPDGAQAVCSVASSDMAENKSSSALWLLSTLGGAPRRLTQCGEKDGQPAFSPTGNLIGFVAKREQGGHKDEAPQFYVIPPDGGEARRVGDVATGVDAFRWCPDGQHIVFVSWVWPGLKGAKAQAAALKAFKARKDTGYATSDAFYRYWDHLIPAGRVVTLKLSTFYPPGTDALLALEVSPEPGSGPVYASLGLREGLRDGLGRHGGHGAQVLGRREPAGGSPIDAG